MTGKLLALDPALSAVLSPLLALLVAITGIVATMPYIALQLVGIQAVLEVAGGPARSPYDPQFNPKSINRIEAIGSDISRHLNKLAKDGTRFVPPAKK